MTPINFSPYLITFLTALLPLTEIRGALPLGLLVYQLPLIQIFVLSYLGNLLGALSFFFFLKYFSSFLAQRIRFINHLLEWLFTRTYKKFYNKHQAWGDLALLFFVALPLPITGGWSGAVAAFLFKIPLKKAILLLSGGILIAGIVVTLLTLATDSFFFS